MRRRRGDGGYHMKACPRKDEMGNHFVHDVRYDGNWWGNRRVLMCNSRGNFKPVAEVHAKRVAKAKKANR
jgi:hypothetical protein